VAREVPVSGDGSAQPRGRGWGRGLWHEGHRRLGVRQVRQAERRLVSKRLDAAIEH
jgi:hypothetical protein